MSAEKLREIKQKGERMANIYCRQILSAAPDATIMVSDLERAFMAGYEAGTLHDISNEEFMDAMKRLADRIASEVSDA